jgi:hypothetical protein
MVEVFIMSSVWGAIKAIRLAKAKLGWSVKELSKAGYTPNAEEAATALIEMAAASNLVEMHLSKEDAQVWQQEVREKIKQIYLEWHKKKMLTNVDIGMVRRLVEEVKRAAERWLDRMRQGEVRAQEGYERNLEEDLQYVIEFSGTFLEITADWVVEPEEPKTPKEVVRDSLAEIDKRLKYINSTKVSEHSRALVDIGKAFEGLRAALEAALAGNPDKKEIGQRINEFTDAWHSFEKEIEMYRGFGSMGVINAAAEIWGRFFPELLVALSDLGWYSRHQGE